MMSSGSFSFRNVTVALASSDIKNLSFEGIGSDTSFTSSEDDEYSFDFSIYEEDDSSDDQPSFAEDSLNDQPSFAEDSFFGTFRWTDLTKVANESPEMTQRKQSATGDRTRNDKAMAAPRRRKLRALTDDTLSPPPPPPPRDQLFTELGDCISLLPSNSTNSPRTVMGWDGKTRDVVQKTLKKQRHQQPMFEFEIPIVVEGFIEEDTISVDYESLQGSCM